MFGDIRQIDDHGGDRSHFMATVVGLQRGKKTIGTTEHGSIDIVDGQQRITTLILLLKAIADAVDPSDTTEAKVREELMGSLVKDDEATLLLLQTNHDSSDFFANYIRNGTHPPSEDAGTVADRELLAAIEDCEQFVADWQSTRGSLVLLVTILKNRLTFVFHEISDEALVYTVFEVLNSRGLDVSWFDRLKSMLMAIVFETGTGSRSEIIDEVHSHWTEIYACVGLSLRLSRESLRFAATLRNPGRPSRLLSEEDAALLLRDQSKDGPRQVINTTQWLKDVTIAVDRLEDNPRRNAVTRIVQARMVATAIYVRRDFTEEERTQLLRRWENVTFRIYGMFRKDARWAVGNYVRLAWSIIQDQLSVDEVLKRLKSIGGNYPVSEAVESLKKTNWYEYREELGYFLHRYEEHLSRKAGLNFDNEQWNRIWATSASNSIEHIRPQSWWTSRGQEDDEGRMHGLGNLLLLPPRLNSKLKDKSASEKADAYTKTGLLIAQEVADLISTSGWTFEAMQERENDLLEWALKEWAD